MAKWYESANGWVSGLTDALGITDSKAPQRAANAAREGMDAANLQLDWDLQGTNDMLNNAIGNGRSLDQTLNNYDYTMGNAMAGTQKAGQNALGEMDAGSAGNVQNYLNPKMDEMLRGTAQAVAGRSGSTLQSSAANRNIADTVSNQAGQMWDTAFNQALGDSSHNLQANNQFGQTNQQLAGMAGQQYQVDSDPVMNWMNMNNDRAMARYGANTGITQANVQAAGTPNTWL